MEFNEINDYFTKNVIFTKFNDFYENDLQNTNYSIGLSRYFAMLSKSRFFSKNNIFNKKRLFFVKNKIHKVFSAENKKNIVQNLPNVSVARTRRPSLRPRSGRRRHYGKCAILRKNAKNH